MDRSTVFGGIADKYDRYRPSYPTAMWDTLHSIAGLEPGASILEVGCGTGLATVELVRRGHSVVAIDVDERMLDVAKRRGLEGVTFVESRFEEFDQGPFEMIFAGSSWHWVDPAVGLHHASELLSSNGLLVMAWNLPMISRATFAEPLDAIYAEIAPDMVDVASHVRTKDEGHHFEQLSASEFFGDPTYDHYDWERAVTPDEFAGILSTHSDHILLGEEKLGELLGRIVTVAANQRSGVAMPYRTVMCTARITS